MIVKTTLSDIISVRKSCSDNLVALIKFIVDQQCVNILNEFIKTTAVSASKQLVESDQLLMKTQVILMFNMFKYEKNYVFFVLGLITK